MPAAAVGRTDRGERETGDIAWRVPLGSYDEVEAQGLKNAGAPNMGGSIATAGGLVFIAATTDSKFRAFDSRTGKELWMARAGRDRRRGADDVSGDGREAVRGDRGGGHESFPHDREYGGRDGGLADRVRAAEVTG